MNHSQQSQNQPVAEVFNRDGKARTVLVCEHASNDIPQHLNGLGLSTDAVTSHAAWDPGAAPVAKAMARILDAPLVLSNVSRLVYDCNRPPDASDAMPARSEVFEVPGNAGLTDADRRARTASYYTPFETLLSQTLEDIEDPQIVTIHSFTPVYHGTARKVEIGVLHDSDTRLADALLHCAAAHTDRVVQRNAPYGPQDGVTHTLKRHGLTQGRPNVMLEIRNDLIATPAAQQGMAQVLTNWIRAALAQVDLSACKA